MFVPVILTISYCLIVYLVWKAVPFTGKRKVILILTIFPVFLGSMFLSIWIVDNHFPKLLEEFNAAKTQATELTRQGMSGRKVERVTGEAKKAFQLSLPAAVILSGC